MIALLLYTSTSGLAQIQKIECDGIEVLSISPHAVKKLDSIRVELQYLQNETTIQQRKISVLETERRALEGDVRQLSAALDVSGDAIEGLNQERAALRKAESDLRQVIRQLEKDIRRIKKKNTIRTAAIGSGAIIAILLILII